MYYDDGREIKSAVSIDGKSFKKEGGVRLKGRMGTIIKLPDSTYRTYFVNAEDTTVRSATSKNGIDFSLEKGVRLARGDKDSLDFRDILHLDIVELSDGRYRLYYDAVSVVSNIGSSEEGSFEWSILSATSSDGLKWQKDKGVRLTIPTEGKNSPGPEVLSDDYETNIAANPHVVYGDKQYILYFDMFVYPLGKSGIYKAVSSDGLKFTLDPKPVLARDPKYKDDEGFDEFGLKGMPQEPSLLKTGCGERLFFWLAREGIFSAFREDL